MRDKYAAGPVVLGEYAVVMSGCMLLAGTRVPARSVVAAGSVVDTRLTDELTLYRGNPAVAVRELPAARLLPIGATCRPVDLGPEGLFRLREPRGS